MNKIMTMKELDGAYRPLGRTLLQNDSLVFDYTCSGFELALYCKGVVTATMQWRGLYGKIGVWVDGKEQTQISLQNGENKLILAHGLIEGEHIIRVEKLSEASRAGAQVDNIGFNGAPAIAPLPSPCRLVAIGDSLTAGLWNETYAHEVHDELNEQGFYQDGSQTWAALTAQNLDMEYTAIAFSGWGVLRGYGNFPENNVPRVLDCTAPFSCPDEKWDYSDDATVVVINLSTNDSSVYNDESSKGLPTKEDFLAAAKKLCAHMREKYPTAPIIWANGFSGIGAFEDEIKEAVSGDNMHYLVLPCNQEGGQWHPTLEGHALASQYLTQFIIDLGV